MINLAMFKPLEQHLQRKLPHHRPYGEQLRRLRFVVPRSRGPCHLKAETPDGLTLPALLIQIRFGFKLSPWPPSKRRMPKPARFLIPARKQKNLPANTGVGVRAVAMNCTT